MSKKNIVAITAAGLMFVAAGYILYTGIFAGSSSPSNGTGNTATVQVQQILPYGHRMDFESVRNYSPVPRPFNYPLVQSVEVGAGLAGLLNNAGGR